MHKGVSDKTGNTQFMTAQRISDMLGVSDGAMDNPTGSSWSMGVAMLVLFSVEQQFELRSNFPSSCIAELTLRWANG